MIPSGSRSSKLSLSERVEKVGTLVGHLRSMASRAALRRPAWRMLIGRSLVYLMPGVGLAMMAAQSYVVGGVLILLTPPAAGLLLFYDVGQRGRIAYHVARYSRNEPSYAAGATEAVSGKRWKLVLLGVMEWLERRFQSKKEDSGMLMKLLGAALGELLDVAGAFLVPAVVLDDVDIGEAVERVKRLKDNAPEALLASVGFDAVASLISTAFWVPVIVVPVAAVGGTAAGVLTIPQAVGVAAALALLLAVPLAAVQTLQEAAKAVYFTALYLLVAHSEEVSEERRGSLESLVRFGEPEEEPGAVPAGAG